MNDHASKFRRIAPCRLAAALLCGGLLLGGIPPRAAPAGVGIQPLESIREAAEHFVRSQMPAGQADILVTPGRLDPRLRLARCGGALDASFISGGRLQAQVSIAVACRVAANWTIYVPVTVQSRISVWALRAPRTQGARLSASDVMAEKQLVSGLAAGYVTDVSELTRATLRHALPAGAILTSGDLLPDYMVRQGEQVTMVAAIGGIQVRAAGLALQSGRYGALIRVQNASSAKVVQGIVEGDRVVDVTP
ncbi:MAG: flagellar basal body P-ring formation chaperone FlgA [Steroidobacteraceae bacterium]